MTVVAEGTINGTTFKVEAYTVKAKMKMVRYDVTLNESVIKNIDPAHVVGVFAELLVRSLDAIRVVQEG